MRIIKIFDTTLRDGEQAPGCTMNVKEKVELARQLEALGVDVIEAGFAISSEKDFEAVSEVSKVIQKATVVSLCRLVKEDIDRSFEALKDAAHPRLHLFIATSDIHLEYKLQMTREQVLQAVKEQVAYAKTLCDDVEFSAEDASRSDRTFLTTVYQAAVESGATVINIPDTVGYATPQEMYELVSEIKQAIHNEAVTISVHCHNDLGLAVACTLASVKAGATQVECTVNGIGERAGNAALEEIVMGLDTRAEYFQGKTHINTKQIYRTSKLLSTITGIAIPPNKPIVGANAFSHESGIHQHGVMRNANTYEIMSSSQIGIPQNKMVLGKHSGKHAFQERLLTLGYLLSDHDLQKAFESFKKLCDKKKNVTDKDIEALVSENATTMQKAYEYISFVINSGNTITSTANVKLLVGEEEIEKVAVGDGPVDACFRAINKIVKKEIHLENYTIQSVTDGVDALGEVVVKVRSKHGMITGRGLSTDIIEASIKAYLNAINKI
ncbi:2-isopropylmalate synthase [Paludicola sp. MB14-C6]|uniref:2-isopropylmalate synthase n=1 Tax=Paludihabitans sp. MB14-C6 TaxID=3070656 RepID=UPI0035A2A5C5